MADIKAPSLDDLSLEDLKALREAKKSGNLADSNISLEGLKTLKAINQAKNAQPETSALKAAQTGVEQAISFGARPAIAGLGSAIGQTVADIQFAPKSSQPLMDFVKGIPGRAIGAFKAGRQEAIQEQRKSAEEHPVAATVGQLGGAAATLPLTAVKGLAGAIGLGAAQGAGTAIGEADSLADAAKQIGTGAAIGGATFGLGKGLEKGAKSASAALEKAAETKAFKATGAMLKDFRAAFNKGKVNELGRAAIDNGLIKAGDTVDDIAVRSQDILGKTGKQIGEIYDNALEAITDQSRLGKLDPTVRAGIEASGFRPQSQKKEILSKIESFVKGKPGSTAALGKVQTLLDEVGQSGDNITPKEALAIKGQIDDLINYTKKTQDLPLVQQAYKQVRSFISDKINTQIELIDYALPSPQSQLLKQLNKQYGNISEIAAIAKDRALRDNANSFIGLRDAIAGSAIGGGALAAQASRGDISADDLVRSGLLGLGAGLASRGARRFGPATGVLAREAGSKALSSLAPAFSAGSPALGIPLIEETNAVQRRMKNANNR